MCLKLQSNMFHFMDTSNSVVIHVKEIQFNDNINVNVNLIDIVVIVISLLSLFSIGHVFHFSAFSQTNPQNQTHFEI